MNRDSIDIRYLSTKAQSKHEIYRLITVEANLYLPPEKEWSIYFIRDILQLKKRVFEGFSLLFIGNLQWRC